MRNRLFRYLDIFLFIVKILLAIFMIYSGIVTGLTVATAPHGALAYIVAHRWILWIICTAFTGSGVWLAAGMALKKKIWVSRALFLVFCCFVFAFILQGQAFDWVLISWVPDFVAAIATGLIWLRWRFRTAYINVHDFRQEVIKLDKYHKI